MEKRTEICDRCEVRVEVRLGVSGVCPTCGLPYVWDTDNDGVTEWSIVAFDKFCSDEDLKSVWDDQQYHAWAER